MGCRGSDFDARIVSCSRLIERGRRETKSNQITAYMNRGAAYRAKGDFDRALADLDKALRLDPKSVHALTERASIYFAKGEFDRAISDYDAAISGQSQSPAAFYGRGEAYRAKNDFDRAIADYDKALQLDKDSRSLMPVGPELIAAREISTGRSPISTKPLKLDPKFGVNAYRSRRRLSGRGRFRSGHRRLRRGDPDRSQRCERLPQPGQRLSRQT